jgi:hypothetical protein
MRTISYALFYVYVPRVKAALIYDNIALWVRVTGKDPNSVEGQKIAASRTASAR